MENGVIIREEKIISMKVDRSFIFILRNRLLPENHDFMVIAKIEEIKDKEE